MRLTACDFGLDGWGLWWVWVLGLGFSFWLMFGCAGWLVDDVFGCMWA